MYIKFKNDKIKQVVEVGFAEYTDSPREFLNLGTFYTWIKEYMSPDKNEYATINAFISKILGHKNVEGAYSECKTLSEFISYISKRAEVKGYILEPISLYEHTGLTYSLGVKYGWDSGVVGFIFVSKNKIREVYGCRKVTKSVRNRVVEDLKNEVDSYNKWANGEVFEYKLSDFEGNQIDSCCGFYEDVYDEKTMYEMVSEMYPIGEIGDWYEVSVEDKEVA